MCACSTPKPVNSIFYHSLSVTLPPLAQVACANPCLLPEHDLNAQEVARYWSRDRAALLICEQRRDAAVKAVFMK
ncbi:hypothetical protein ACMY46_06225 [Bartonella bacilliformis]|uniref:hypothetical protein n=1 Tax=Bartonella bacilliformis TaxID=774 RepID=UPI00049EB2C5|nr:hypothetical protein H705_00953 [Bartonella bacilliformis Cond044]